MRSTSPSPREQFAVSMVRATLGLAACLLGQGAVVGAAQATPMEATADRILADIRRSYSRPVVIAAHLQRF